MLQIGQDIHRSYAGKMLWWVKYQGGTEYYQGNEVKLSNNSQRLEGERDAKSCQALLVST